LSPGNRGLKVDRACQTQHHTRYLRPHVFGDAARIMDDLATRITVGALPAEHQQLIAGDNQAKHL